MIFKAIVEYEYPTEHKHPIKAEIVLHGDRVVANIKPFEQKMGHWIFDDECREHGHCSECGYGSIDLMDGEPHDFCRRCGAKME